MGTGMFAGKGEGTGMMVGIGSGVGSGEYRRSREEDVQKKQESKCCGGCREAAR